MQNEQEQYRLLTEDELDQSIRLGLFAFQYEMTQEEFERSKQQMNPKHIWGCFIDGELAAQVTFLPMTAYVNGVKLAMGGVAGVSTYPEHRRGGKVAKLLTLGLQEMKENGITWSTLAPFSFAFYRKYGWEHYVDRKKYTIATYLLPKIPASDIKGTLSRIAPNSSVIGPIYERYAAQYNGMLSRPADWWEQRIFDRRKGQLALYTDVQGVPQGYAHCEVKNRVLTVHEFVALTYEAELALWRYIGQHDSMVTQIELYVPVDNYLSFWLDEPRITQQIESYFMARIVEVDGFIRQYPFESISKPIQFTMDITDRYAPWNEARFAVTIDSEGSATIERVHKEGEAELICSIQTLTALLLGYRTASQLHIIGRLAGTPQLIDSLATIIPRRTPYLADFY